MLIVTDHAERLALYHAGATDEEIGRRLYLTTSAVGYWRRKHGLPCTRVDTRGWEKRRRREEL